jgi:hypothetical protein
MALKQCMITRRQVHLPTEICSFLQNLPSGMVSSYKTIEVSGPCGLTIYRSYEFSLVEIILFLNVKGGHITVVRKKFSGLSSFSLTHKQAMSSKSLPTVSLDIKL